jgi:hypothetical protein
VGPDPDLALGSTPGVRRAAAAITRAENRATNATANHTVGRHRGGSRQPFTGFATGRDRHDRRDRPVTTVGVAEAIVRAQVAKESWYLRLPSVIR